MNTGLNSSRTRPAQPYIRFVSVKSVVKTVFLNFLPRIVTDGHRKRSASRNAEGSGVEPDVLGRLVCVGPHLACVRGRIWIGADQGPALRSGRARRATSWEFRRCFQICPRWSGLTQDAFRLQTPNRHVEPFRQTQGPELVEGVNAFHHGFSAGQVLELSEMIGAARNGLGLQGVYRKQNDGNAPEV